MTQAILKMEHITKEFPGVRALSDVTIEACKGEILSIVGENGAGKSTLMKILSGSYPHDTYQGRILINQEEVKFSDTSQSEKAGIAMIYQELNMHLDLNVAENLFLGRWKQFGRSINWKKLYEQSEEYLKMVNLEVNPREILRNLNTSKQQLISIARALSHHPKILVLDEPTASLTNAESTKLFAIMHQLKAQGYTCILISHKLDEVFEYSDRIIVMRDGMVINTHEKAEFDQSVIIAEMVGRRMENLYPKEAVPIGETVLRVEGFTVPHPQNAKKRIVENISFQVRKGEILGIGGLVGAGRSELVDAVFGKTGRQSGRIFVEEKEITVHTPSDAIANGIALVTEDRKADGFVGGMSIRNNITLASLKDIGRYGMINAAMEEEAAQKYFEELNVKANHLDVKVNTLSGGNQQKVVLSKWLMKHPKVLILDEPTRGIDVGAKYEIYKIMVNLARQGMGIVMISSELPELISMSDRIIVLANGRLTGEIEGREATQEKIMHLATMGAKT